MMAKIKYFVLKIALKWNYRLNLALESSAEAIVNLNNIWTSLVLRISGTPEHTVLKLQDIFISKQVLRDIVVNISIILRPVVADA